MTLDLEINNPRLTFSTTYGEWPASSCHVVSKIRTQRQQENEAGCDWLSIRRAEDWIEPLKVAVARIRSDPSRHEDGELDEVLLKLAPDHPEVGIVLAFAAIGYRSAILKEAMEP